MTVYKESKVLLEVRKIKERMAQEAERVGFEKYYLSLNERAARLQAKYRRKRRKATRAAG